MKKYLVAWLLVFIAWMFGGFLVHGVILQAEYLKLPALFRPHEEQPRYLPFNMLAHVLMAGALVWIYARGISARPWLGQGVRFGVAAALMSAVPGYLIYYAVQPMPPSLVAKQMIFDGAWIVLLGVLVAFLYRKETGATA